MNAVVYHGNSTARGMIRSYEFEYPKAELKKAKLPSDTLKFNALITTVFTCY